MSFLDSMFGAHDEYVKRKLRWKYPFNPVAEDGIVKLDIFDDFEDHIDASLIRRPEKTTESLPTLDIEALKERMNSHMTPKEEREMVYRNRTRSLLKTSSPQEIEKMRNAKYFPENLKAIFEEELENFKKNNFDKSK